MRSSHLLFSAVHLLVSLFITAVGVSLVLFPHAAEYREMVFRLMSDNSHLLSSLGAFVMALGALLFIGFYNMHKKRYYRVRMNTSKVLIEESIIREYIKSYWDQLFGKGQSELEVVIAAGQKIEIIAELPAGIDDEAAFFERVRNELGVLLARRLGYEKEFFLTITH